jgi:hypothetical protein
LGCGLFTASAARSQDERAEQENCNQHGKNFFHIILLWCSEPVHNLYYNTPDLKIKTLYSILAGDLFYEKEINHLRPEHNTIMFSRIISSPPNP